MSKSELDPELYASITTYCQQGDALARSKDYKSAIALYNQAWTLIPDPKNNWGASTWVLAAIADASFLGGYKTSAMKALSYAMTCPDAIGNPFLHLRYGQVLLDKNEEDAAADELMRAYMGGGEEIFATEDGRYLNFLKTRAMF